MLNSFWKPFLSLCLLAAVIGCSSSDSVDPVPEQSLQVQDFTFVQFDIASGNPAGIALPNDLLRDPQTGLVNIPPTGDPSVDGLSAQINTLSGFSTTAPIYIPFTGLVDHTTVNSQTVLVLDINDTTGNPLRPVQWSVTDTDGNSRATGVPVMPLDPAHTHVVVITEAVIGSPSGRAVESDGATIITKRPSAIVDAQGNSLVSSLTNDQAVIFEQVRQAYQPIWAAAESVTGRDRLFIPFAFAFTTQPLYGTLEQLRTQAKAQNYLPSVDVGVVGVDQVDQFFNIAGLSFVPHDAIAGFFSGSISMPRYIGNPLLDSFTVNADGSIQQKGNVDVPFLAFLPPGEGPFPVMIFQHGITRSNEDVFAIANSATSAGVAVIAIDLWMHGGLTFDVDVANNETGAPGPDGVPDASGANFINLQSLLTSRDNIRQSVANLYSLTHMITSGHADFTGDGFPEFLPLGVTFTGISLGGIVGTPFATTEPNVNLAVANVTGGRIATLLQNSPTFGPAINAGLAGFGIPEGSFLYDLFFLVAQTILDDGDPINYGPSAASGNLSGGVPTTILIQEAIGDTVIPNSASRDLALAMGLPQVAAVEMVDGLAQVDAPYVGSGFFQFANGSHGMLLDPAAGPAVAVQTQALTFLFQGLLTGNAVIIDPFAGAAKVQRKLPELYLDEIGPFQLFPMQ